jgi:serine/threonine protein phosphatase PrpC
VPTAPLLEVGRRTDTGWRRTFNEDRVFADPPSHPSIEETRGLPFAIADGTGMGQSGALAADRAITTVKDEYYHSGTRRNWRRDPGSASNCEARDRHGDADG